MVLWASKWEIKATGRKLFLVSQGVLGEHQPSGAVRRQTPPGSARRSLTDCPRELESVRGV